MHEIEVAQLTKDVEQGKENAACQLLKAVHDLPFGEKISALNQIRETNASDRKADPSLPEIKVSNSTVTKNSFDEHDKLNKEICDFLDRGPCTENHQELKVEIPSAGASYKIDLNLNTGNESQEASNMKCKLW